MDTGGLLLPTFNLRLRPSKTVYTLPPQSASTPHTLTPPPPLIVFGYYDGKTPTITYASSKTTLAFQQLHLSSNDPSSHPASETDGVMNVGSALTSLAILSLPLNPQDVMSNPEKQERPFQRDVLVMGLAQRVWVYDVYENVDVFLKEIEETVRWVGVGKVRGASVVFVAGDSILQGFDHKGNDVFFIMTGDVISTALTLGLNKETDSTPLLLASEDNDIRLFQNEDWCSDMSEHETAIQLIHLKTTSRISKGGEKKISKAWCTFGYILSDGTFGVFDGVKGKRLWRHAPGLRDANGGRHAVSFCGYDINRDGNQELIIAYSDGKVEGRRSLTGEIIWTSDIGGKIAGVKSHMLRDNVGEDLIIVMSDGVVKGFCPAEVEVGVALNETMQSEELLFRQLAATKQSISSRAKKQQEQKSTTSKNDVNNSSNPSLQQQDIDDDDASARLTGLPPSSLLPSIPKSTAQLDSSVKINKGSGHPFNYLLTPTSLTITSTPTTQFKSIILTPLSASESKPAPTPLLSDTSTTSYAPLFFFPFTQGHTVIDLKRRGQEIHSGVYKMNIIYTLIDGGDMKDSIHEDTVRFVKFWRIKAVEGLDGGVSMNSDGLVVFHVKERIETIYGWFQNSFSPLDSFSNMLVGKRLLFEGKYEHDGSHLSILLENGKMTIKTCKIKTAVEIIEDLCAYCHQQDVDLVSFSFPSYQTNLEETVMQMSELNGLKMGLAVESGEMGESLRLLIAHAEDCRDIGDIKGMKKDVSIIFDMHRDSQFEYIKRLGHHNQAIQTLHHVNQMVYDFASLRGVGSARMGILSGVREAVRASQWNGVVSRVLRI